MSGICVEITQGVVVGWGWGGGGARIGDDCPWIDSC